jgi:RsiW-degrading membrane proteinase PrsW (M82 family)
MPETKHCCICGDPVHPPYNMIGGRAYCERHYAALNRPNTSFWRASLVQIAGMALFSAIIAALASFVGPLDRTQSIVVGLVLAIVPTALWLIYFYQQDRLEPEPKSMVAQVFLLALLLTQAVGLPLINDVFRIRDWAASSTLTSLGASILIYGFILQAITYLAVRLVYASPEFDERMDGIVYGTVAGLGVATLLNLRYIVDNEGVALAPGVVETVTTALAQASFAGLLGYFMAQAKFEHRPIWWVPAGFTLAAVLNGLFSWLLSEVSAAGMSVEVWRSLALGLVVALAVFFVLVLLMRQTTEVTLRRAGAAR